MHTTNLLSKLTRLQEADQMEFDLKKRERDEEAEAKTAKNRAKRQKKKGKSKGGREDGGDRMSVDGPIKKRRLVNGKELVFKKREDGSGDEDEDVEPEAVAVVAPGPSARPKEVPTEPIAQPAVDTAKIIFHDDD